MTYTIWLKVEDDEGVPNDTDAGWCAVSESLADREAAITKAEEILTVLERSGYDISDPLDGWHQ